MNLQDALTSLGRAVIGLQIEHHGRRMSLYPTSNGWLAIGIAEGCLDDEGYPEPDTAVEGGGDTPREALDNCLREALALEMEADADKEAVIPH